MTTFVIAIVAFFAGALAMRLWLTRDGNDSAAEPTKFPEMPRYIETSASASDVMMSMRERR